MYLLLDYDGARRQQCLGFFTLKACICSVFQAGKRLLSSSPEALIFKADLKYEQGRCISTGVWPVLVNLPREPRILFQDKVLLKH